MVLSWRADGDDLGTFCLDHAAEIIETGALVDEFLVTTAGTVSAVVMAT
ncbi:MAG: hypothetical protein KIT79_15955 [Deltaproteobacteria bacterium]|nr:hypothetical protein [Deltaproteobacteria bacterium]